MGMEENRPADPEQNETALRLVHPAVVAGMEYLRQVKSEWEREAAEVESLAPTEENKALIKERRAEDRKRRDEIWSRCKSVMDEVTRPAATLKEVFAECVDQPFKRLDAAAKAKVESIETAQKAAALEQCQRYYDELCAVHGVDFLSWVDFVRLTKFNIRMTEAKKTIPSGHFDEINTYLARVACDLDAIGNAENSAAVLAEYKGNGLDFPKAILAVNKRHAAEEAARQEAAQRAEAQRRADGAAKRAEEAAREHPIPAATPPVAVQGNGESAGESAFPSVFRFTLYFDTARQWELVKPLLVSLKKVLEMEKVRYN